MNNAQKLISVLFVSAIAGAFMGSASSANAASLMDTCRQNTKQQIIRCCDTWVRQNGRPLWMMDANTNCHTTSVTCVTKKYAGIAAVAFKPKCIIEMPDTPTHSSGNTPPPPKGNFKP